MKEMRMRLVRIILLSVMLAVAEVSARGRGGGGGRSGGFSRGGGGRSRGSSYSSSGSRGIKKSLIKGAAVGAGAYAGYKLTKATAKFAANVIKAPYSFEQWNSWREVDGFMCRTDSDCTWLDNDLECQDRTIQFSLQQGWYNGDYASIRGECDCRDGYWWDGDELVCRVLSGVDVTLAVILGLSCSTLFCCCCVIFVKKCICDG